MSNLLLKAVKHVVAAKRDARLQREVEHDDNCDKICGGTYYLGGGIQVKIRKLPFIPTAMVEVTDNNRGLRLSETVDYPKEYLNVNCAYADKVFEISIQDIITRLKAI